MDKVIEPYTISYQGGLADDHLVNSEELANSILGSSKISTALIHYIFIGRVPKGNYKKEFQCVTSPFRPGSLDYSQYIIPIAIGIVQNPEGFRIGTEMLFQLVWDSLKKRLTKGKNENFETMADTLLEMGQGNNEALLEAFKIFAQSMGDANQELANVAKRQSDIAGQMARFYAETMPEMARAQKTNAINLVQPVGSSCDKMSGQFYRGYRITIDIPEAEIIRSEGEETVGEVETFYCNRLTELNLNTGHCILDIEGYEDNITGQISDPVLSNPNNIYSKVLDEHSPIYVTGKPIIKDGEIARIHISNARQ